MKVLWFTNTSSMYRNNNNPYYGGGWIESLEQLITEKTDIELAIAFLHSEDDKKQVRGKVTYYPVLRKKKNGVSKLIYNWACTINSREYLDDLLSVIGDYKPDLVQIFGTEGPFGLTQETSGIPTVIHIQGLMTPYYNAFYPPGISSYELLFEPGFLKNHALGNSILFNKRRFDKQALREQQYFRHAKYLMGRTNWDHLISTGLASNAAYFHIDEVLRPHFYDSVTWEPQKRDKIIIASTISNTIYKGFDLVLKTAAVLKKHTSLDFEWQIAGMEADDKLIHFFERHLKLKCKDYNIRLLGVKNSTELIDILKNADLFIHPSYIDNSPNSVCEAQFLGIPVIACYVGGIPSLIENNKTGILVPPNDPYLLAMQIRESVVDKDKCKLLGIEGRKAAMIRHDRNKIQSDIIASYKSIISNQN